MMSYSDASNANYYNESKAFDDQFDKQDSYWSPNDTQSQSRNDNNRTSGPQSQTHSQTNTDNQMSEGIPFASADDMRLIRECQRESFYYRSVPFSAASCALIYYLMKTRRNIRPTVWHYVSAVSFGWIAGKLSYFKTCEQRLAHSSSNSPFAKAVRRRRGLYTEDYQTTNKIAYEGSLESDWQSNNKSQTYSDASYGSHEFADDKDVTHQPKDRDIDSKPQFNTTYDELRARNRAALKM